jgi:hypothetical protein
MKNLTDAEVAYQPRPTGDGGPGGGDGRRRGPGGVMDVTVSTVLDEAFERMASSSAFELPNGFVNHGPMGCEALAAMDLEDQIDHWSRRFERVPGPPVIPVPAPELDWTEALGDYRLLPEWIGHLQLAIGEHGWAEVLRL